MNVGSRGRTDVTRTSQTVEINPKRTLDITFANVKDTSWYCDDIAPVLNRVDANGQRQHQREIVGRDARMRCEKSRAPSAACATSLMSERRRSSSNGSVVSIRPER